MVKPYQTGTDDAYLLVAIDGAKITPYSASDADEALQRAQSLSLSDKWAAVFSLRQDQVYGVVAIFLNGQRRSSKPTDNRPTLSSVS